MAQFFDLEHTKMTISRKAKFIKIGATSAENVYFFTEVDNLEEVIETLQRMLGDWRDELALKKVEYHDED